MIFALFYFIFILFLFLFYFFFFKKKLIYIKKNSNILNYNIIYNKIDLIWKKEII